MKARGCRGQRDSLWLVAENLPVRLKETVEHDRPGVIPFRIPAREYAKRREIALEEADGGIGEGRGVAARAEAHGGGTVYGLRDRTGITHGDPRAGRASFEVGEAEARRRLLRSEVAGEAAQSGRVAQGRRRSGKPEGTGS